MNYPSNAAEAASPFLPGLSDEAKRVLGPTHVVWSCYLGDLTQSKTRVINEMVAEGYSQGWVQAIANWPTQAQEVILRLVIEKKMTSKQITEKIGFKPAHVTATTTIARKLGFLPEAVDKLASIRAARIAKLSAHRKAIKAARDNPEATLKSIGINKDNRHATRDSAAVAVAKAAAILRGEVEVPTAKPTDLDKGGKLALAEGYLNGAPPAPYQTSPSTTMVVDQVAQDALAALPEVDPSKRTVRVTLDLTLEELSDFSAAVAKKRAEEAQA